MLFPVDGAIWDGKRKNLPITVDGDFTVLH